jgi:signal transduction histidine kinase
MKLDVSSWGRPWRQIRSLVVAGVCVWGLASSNPGTGLHGRGLLLSGLLIVATVGWLTCIFFDRSIRVVAVGAAVAIVAGLAIFGIGPNPIGLVYVGSALVTVAVRLPTRWALTYAVLTAIGYTTAEMLGRANLYWVGGGLGGIALSYLSGAIRRQAEERTQERELLLASQAQSAALAERARIAREIHDVLAHTLTALSVQLETVDALLDRDRPEQARETVHRAQTLMREGLAETRRAISALRTDAPPLPELLRMLADAYSADTGATSTVEVSGPERKIAAEAGLTFFRAAQEAVTNVRKHAPGAAIAMCLKFDPDDVRLTVTNTGGGKPAPSAYDRVGGYGLTGLRERAELAGGRFTADPIEHGWRVDVMIPT